MEAAREVKGQSEWVMKVTDKWGQGDRGYYSVGEKKSRHSGWWDDRHRGCKEKEDVIQQERRADIAGSADDRHMVHKEKEDVIRQERIADVAGGADNRQMVCKEKEDVIQQE